MYALQLVRKIRTYRKGCDYMNDIAKLEAEILLLRGIIEELRSEDAKCMTVVKI